MYEYIKGEVIEASPAHAIIESHGVGYFFNISVNTYTRLNGQKEAQLYIHENIREDAFLFFGFYDTKERATFRHLISVSGVGANTARMMLSSMSPEELSSAIASGDVNALKAIKGIGAKSAQRIIVELKDKFEKEGVEQKILIPQNNTIKDEALSALVMLGFVKNNSQKVIDKILATEPEIRVEEVIKKALKML